MIEIKTEKQVAAELEAELKERGVPLVPWLKIAVEVFARREAEIRRVAAKVEQSTAEYRKHVFGVTDEDEAKAIFEQRRTERHAREE